MSLLPFTAVADPVGYVVGFDTLYRIDLATGQTTAAGPIGFADVEGLALASNGTLYGVADAGTGAPNSSITDVLLRIDTATGAGTLVGPLGLQGMGVNGNLDYGLAFTADGRLWLSSDVSSQLWEVAVGNGATRLVGTTGRSISGLAARGNELFGVSVDAAPSLYRIDPSSGASTLIGALNVGGVVADAGLDFDAAGLLWAVLDPEPSAEGPSRLVRLDPATGAGTVTATASVATVGMEGLAIAPPAMSGGGPGVIGVPQPQLVPGPAAPLLALLAALAAFVGLRRLRKA